MRDGTRKQRFDLEELEARVYLSVAPLPIKPHWDCASAVVMGTEVHHEPGAVADSSMSYDPAAQAGSVFEGLTATPTANSEPGNAPCANAQEAATAKAGVAEAQSNVAVANAPNSFSSTSQPQTTAASGGVSSSQVEGSATTSQLVDTMKVPNAPPAVVASSSAVSSSATTGASVASTGTTGTASASGSVGSPLPRGLTSPQDLYAYLTTTFTGVADGSYVDVDNLTLDNGLIQLGSLRLTKPSNGIGATISVEPSGSGAGTFSIGSSVSATFTLVSGSYTTGGSNGPNISLTLSGVTISISSFIDVSVGSFSLSYNPTASTSLTLSNGSTKNATELTLGATGATLFAGINGPTSNSSAVGFTLSNATLGIAIFESTDGNSYYALNTSGGTAGVTGLTGLTLSASNLDLQVNSGTDSSGAAIDFSHSTIAVTNPGGVTLAFTGPEFEASGAVNLILGSGGNVFMTVSGDLAIQSTTISTSEPEVTLGGNGLGGTQLLTIGGSNLSANVGLINSTDDSLIAGVSLMDLTIGMAVVSTGGNTYWGLDSTASSVSLKGLPGATLSASNLTVEINQSTTTTAADFSGLTVQTGGTPLELTDLTTSNGIMAQFGGTVTLTLGGFITLKGTVAFASEATPQDGSVSLPGDTAAGTMLTVGGTGLTLFAGLNGTANSSTTAPFFSGEGVEMDNVSFGLAVVQGTGATPTTYWGLESMAGSAELVGLPSGFVLSASSLKVELNQSNGSAVADFSNFKVPEGGSNNGQEILNFSTQLSEVSGTVTIALDGFAIIEGAITVESQQLSNGLSLSGGGTTGSTVLTVGGTNVSIFAGINGAASGTATSAPFFTGTGIELDGANFTLAVATSGAYSFWGLQATATTVRFDGLPPGWTATLSGITAKLNQSNDSPSNSSMVVADFTSITGLSQLPAASPTLEVDVTNLNLNLGGGLLAQGGVTFSVQNVPAGLETTDGASVSGGTMLAVSGTNLDVFAGINGTFNSSGPPHFGGTGIEVDGLSFALVIINSGGFDYWALNTNSTGSVMLDGLGSLGIQATVTNLQLEVNQSNNFNGTNSSMVVADFSKLPVPSGQTAGSLAIAGLYIGWKQPMLEAFGMVKLTFGDNVSVSGMMALSSQTVSGGLTLSDGSVLTGPFLTIGGTSLTAIFGTGVTGNSPTGLELDAATFGLVLAEDSAAMHHYWALQVQGGTIKTDGFTLSISATNFDLQLNQSDDSGRVIDFTKAAQPVGQTESGLAVPTGPSSDVYIDFSGQTETFSGSASITISIAGISFTLNGNFVFTIPPSGSAEIFDIGETNLNFDLKLGSTSIISFSQTSGQQGAFIATSTGIAGTAALQFQTGLISLSGTISITINTTGAPTTATTVSEPGGGTYNLPIISDSPSFEIEVSNGDIHLGSAAIPIPTIYLLFNSGNIRLEDGSMNPLIDIDPSGTVTQDAGFTSLLNNIPVLSLLNNPDPNALLLNLQQIVTWLTSLAGSSILQTQIPFTGGTTIGQALNFAQGFVSQVYSYMVNIELQSSIQSSSTVSGMFSGDSITLEIGSGVTPAFGAAQTITLANGNYSSCTDIINAINAAIDGNSALKGNVMAQTDADGFLSITLTQAAIANGDTALEMTGNTTGLQNVGFAAASTASPVMSVLKTAFNFNSSNPFAYNPLMPDSDQGFFGELEHVLAQIDSNPNDYGSWTAPLPTIINGQPVYTQEVYTFPLSMTIQVASLTEPFSFTQSFGSIGSATLTGTIGISASITLKLTLGFDMTAASVPVIMSSGAIPVPSTGVLEPTNDAIFTVTINGGGVSDPGDVANMTLTALSTAGDTSVNDLVERLNALFSSTLYSNGSLSSSPSAPTNWGQILVATAAGNQISIAPLQSWLGTINTLEISCAPTNSFATELGFGAHLSGSGASATVYTVATSPMKGLFIEGDGSDAPSVSGSLTVTTGVRGTTSGGVDGSSGSTVTVNLAPVGSSANENLTITSGLSDGGDLNGTVVSVTDDPTLAGGMPTVNWDATNHILNIVVSDGVTTLSQVAMAITNAAGSNGDDFKATIPNGESMGAFVYSQDISGTLQLGFVSVSTSGGILGTYESDGVTAAPLTVTLSLKSQASGSDRFYLSDLMNAITSGGISASITGPTLAGSVLLSLNNISVSGLGFSLPLENPSITLWIPDITNLNYNANTYQAGDPSADEGLFVTFPSLGALPDLSNLGFNQILTALQGVASSLSTLSGFSFLNQPLPLINESINSLLGYAGQFSSLISGLGTSGISSLQNFVTALNTDLEQTLHLSPGVLTISLDDGGLFGASGTTSGGVNGGPGTTATIQVNQEASSGTDAIIFTSTAANGGDLNGTAIHVMNDPSLSNASQPAVQWNASSKTLTILVENGATTLQEVVDAINNYAANHSGNTIPWTAALKNGGGSDDIAVSSLTTSGGTGSDPSTTTIMPGGLNNDFTISSDPTVTGTDYNGSTVVIVGSSSVSGDTAVANWNSLAKILTIQINPGVTDAKAIVAAINSANGNSKTSMPWTALVTSTDSGATTNTGAGVIHTIALEVKLNLSVAYANNMPFSLNLQDLLNSVGGSNSTLKELANLAGSLVQATGSGSLKVTLGADLTLDFGLDLTNPLSIQPFFYTDTGVVLTAKVSAPSFGFTLTLGGIIQVTVDQAYAAISSDGGVNSPPATISLSLNNTDGSGRLYLTGNWFNSSNFTLIMQGGLTAVLPISVEGVPLGSTDTQANGFPGNALVLQIPDLYRLFTGTAQVTTTTGSATIGLPGVPGGLVIKAGIRPQQLHRRARRRRHK